MESEKVLSKLQSVFDDVFFDEVILTRDLTANDVDEWDSLIQVSLIVAIEQKLGVKFNLGEVEGTKNVGDLVDLITSKLK